MATASFHTHQPAGGEHDPSELLDNEDLDSDLSSDGERLPVVQGTLSKWTNYITGWQSRFFVLKDGTLSYFKSPEESAFGCRGAISLTRALVTPHTFDENRFDVCVGEHIWYLRCDSRDLRTTWIRALESHRTCQESGLGSESSLKRHNSLLSLTSGSQSIASQGSFRRGHGVKEKLAEIDTFREMLVRQVDTLQGYFDLCGQLAASSPAAVAAATRSVDLEDDVVENGGTRGDIESLDVGNNGRCDDDDTDEEDDPGSATITAATVAGSSSQSAGSAASGGGGSSLFSFFSRRSTTANAATSPARPGTFGDASTAAASATVKPLVDYDGYVRLLRQHGGHAVDFKGEANTFRATTAGIIHQMSSCLELMTQREEQWKKRLDREMERRRKLEDLLRQLRHKLEVAEKRAGDPMGPDFEEGPCCQLDEEEFFDAIDAQLDKMDIDASNMSRLRHARLPNHSLDPGHPLTEEIMRVCQTHWDNWGASSAGMELLEKDGELAVYRKQMEEEGMIIDPILATYTVSGVSAREVAEYFWDLHYRLDWEHTLDSAPIVVDTLAADTVLLHQIYRRVWPTAQRDAVFWSHIRHDERRTMVVNFSTDYNAPPLTNSRQRMRLNVSMICETELPPELPADRRHIRCRIQYAANINPGGWAPATVLRQVAKREYPKFLRRFTAYCIDKVKNRPVQL